MEGAFDDGKGNGPEAGGVCGGGHGPGRFAFGEDVCAGLGGGIQFQADHVTGDFVVCHLAGEDFLAGVTAFRIADPGGEVGFVRGVIFGQFPACGGETRFDAEDFVCFGGEGGDAGVGKVIEERFARGSEEAIPDPSQAGLPQRADADPREGSGHASGEGRGFETLFTEPIPGFFTFEVENGNLCAEVGEGDIIVEEDAAAEVGVGRFGVAGEREDAKRIALVKELEDIQNAGGGTGEDGGNGARGGQCGDIVGGLPLEKGNAVGAREAEEADGGEMRGWVFQRVGHSEDILYYLCDPQYLSGGSNYLFEVGWASLEKQINTPSDNPPGSNPSPLPSSSTPTPLSPPYP